MPYANNVVRLVPITQKLAKALPYTTKQAKRLKSLSKQEELLLVSINVLPNIDGFQEQRAWRKLFGLYQDCACVRWSKGFKKTPGIPFAGKMRPSMLAPFLHEAMPMVAEGRAKVHINGEILRRRLVDVLAA